MAPTRPSETSTPRPPHGFWEAWFALWAAAGADTELARGVMANSLAIVGRGALNINTLKGWIKQDPAARKKPRDKQTFLEVVHELRQRAVRRHGQAARSPILSRTDNQWLTALARGDAGAVEDRMQVRVVEASRAARDFLEPEVLPNVDRVADLTSTLGKPLSQISTPLAVVGEGGLGKSVLLRQFYDITGDGNGDPLPILVLCGSIPSSADLSSAESLDAALGVVATEDRDAPPLTTLINHISESRSVTILLDTVDLIVNDDNVDEVVYVLRALSSAGRLIFSCREQEYLNFLDNERGLVQTRYELPLLDVTHVERWARQYLVAEEIDVAHRETFIASLTTPAAAEVCATPLRLAMACDIYARAGAIPDDLTVTELYNQYWNQRIAVDRHGKGTAAARAQEIAADSIAGEMWNASTRQFVVSAPGETVTDDAALQRLGSEGLLRKIGDRYQFFHQTYAEYAVARHLIRIGTEDDLQRLRDALERDTVAGLWPVARHLVTIEMTDDRYRDVAEAIPLTEAEGVRLHFVGAFHRRDARRVAELGGMGDSALLSAGVTVLAEAPPECLPAATDLALRCLELSTSSDMELIGSTCARLYQRTPVGRRPAFLRRFLQTALGRRPHLKKETLPSVICRFIANTVTVDSDDNAIDVLIDFYVDEIADPESQLVTRIELPEAARAALLKVVDAQPSTSQELQTRLLSAAASCPCPSGAVDAVSSLLVRNWPSAAFRRAMGFVSVEAMLEYPLPERWNACQVRLADALCEDVAVAQEVLNVSFSDVDLQRDRWANVAKYIADRHRDLVLETVLALPDDLPTSAVGTACTVVNHVADAMTAAQRARVSKRLRLWIDTNPRRVWPSMIKVSTDDIDLLQDCARLLQSHRTNPINESPTILRSSFDTFLNACTPHQLASLDTDLRALLSADDKQDRGRIAELDGLISMHKPAARERVIEHLNGVATNAAYGAARGLVAAMESQKTTGVDATTAAWLYGLLGSRHANVVRLLAEALERQSSLIEPPFEVAGPIVARRFAQSLDSNDDPQTISALLTLIILFEKRGQCPTDMGTAIVDQLKRAVVGRMPARTPAALRQHLPALFNLHKQALAALAIPHYSAEEVEQAVRSVLTEIDIADIAGRSERTVAHLLITAASRTASVVPLLEALWPTMSDANKGAIVECIMHLERQMGGERSKRLARRDDCPVALKNEIHTRFRV